MSRLLNCKAYMLIFDCGKTKAYEDIEQLNQRAINDGLIKLFQNGKVVAEVVHHYYGYELKWLEKMNEIANKKGTSAN